MREFRWKYNNDGLCSDMDCWTMRVESGEAKLSLSGSEIYEMMRSLMSRLSDNANAEALRGLSDDDNREAYALIEVSLPRKCDQVDAGYDELITDDDLLCKLLLHPSRPKVTRMPGQLDIKMILKGDQATELVRILVGSAVELFDDATKE